MPKCGQVWKLRNFRCERSSEAGSVRKLGRPHHPISYSVAVQKRNAFYSSVAAQVGRRPQPGLRMRRSYFQPPLLITSIPKTTYLGYQTSTDPTLTSQAKAWTYPACLKSPGVLLGSRHGSLEHHRRPTQMDANRLASCNEPKKRSWIASLMNRHTRHPRTK